MMARDSAFDCISDGDLDPNDESDAIHGPPSVPKVRTPRMRPVRASVVFAVTCAFIMVDGTLCQPMGTAIYEIWAKTPHQEPMLGPATLGIAGIVYSLELQERAAQSKYWIKIKAFLEYKAIQTYYLKTPLEVTRDQLDQPRAYADAWCRGANLGSFGSLRWECLRVRLPLETMEWPLSVTRMWKCHKIIYESSMNISQYHTE